MSDEDDTRIPPELQPERGEVDYDLERTLGAIVSLRAHIPEDAFTAPILGTERAGHGVLIGDTGLIVTIGYLVTEANQIWVVTNAGQAVTGDLVGYDYETGFGLVQALGRLDAPVMELGDSRGLNVGEELVVAGYGGPTEALKVHVAARREFAGYWEYVLDDALFTAPAHPNWGGAALIGGDGRLCGIGSLYIDQIVPELPSVDGNLSVPIDFLKPIMDELIMYGRTLKPARPWLGMFVSEVEDRFMIAGVYNDAPATTAGLRAGDVVLDIGGRSATDLSGLFRAMWAVGPAGCEIPLRVERDGETLEIAVTSVDRRDFWKTPSLH
jgi:S1-C subfamily serine protease